VPSSSQVRNRWKAADVVTHACLDSVMVGNSRRRFRFYPYEMLFGVSSQARCETQHALSGHGRVEKDSATGTRLP
jgi:hypothetical protein